MIETTSTMRLDGRRGRKWFIRNSAITVASPTTADGQSRIDALVGSTDGFELAEVDLDLRGEGTILGERQKGKNDLKLASLRHNREVVVDARNAAIALLDEDPELSGHPALADELAFFASDNDEAFLLKG